MAAAQLPEHRSVLADIMGRFGLGAALEKKLEASDRRIEKMRRRGVHNAVVDDEATSSDAGINDRDAPQHKVHLTPSKLRDLYASSSALLPRPSLPRRGDASMSSHSRPSTSIERKLLFEASSDAAATDIGGPHRSSTSAYRKSCFAHSLTSTTPPPTATATLVPIASATPLEGEDALYDGELLPQYLIRLQQRVKEAEFVPADYALVRRNAYDAERRKKVMDAIAAGDAVLRRVGASSGAEATSPVSSPTAATRRCGSVAAVMSVPRPLHPAPAHAATPRVAYASIDAFTEGDARGAHALQMAARAASRAYKNRVAMDDVVGSVSDLEQAPNVTPGRASSPTVDAFLTQLATPSAAASPSSTAGNKTTTPRHGASERAASRLYDQTTMGAGNTRPSATMLSRQGALGGPALRRGARRIPVHPSTAPLVVSGSFDPTSVR